MRRQLSADAHVEPQLPWLAWRQLEVEVSPRPTVRRALPGASIGRGRPIASLAMRLHAAGRLYCIKSSRSTGRRSVMLMTRKRCRTPARITSGALARRVGEPSNHDMVGAGIVSLPWLELTLYGVGGTEGGAELIDEGKLHEARAGQSSSDSGNAPTDACDRRCVGWMDRGWMR